MRGTRAATVEARDGLLIVRIRSGVRQTLDDARANLAACTAEWASAGLPVGGVLLDLTGAVPLEPEVRHFYRGPAIHDICTALGLVVEVSPLGRMMGNVYLRVATLQVPVRVFDREDRAWAWLQGLARSRSGRARRQA
jgi:hypothetical protein